MATSKSPAKKAAKPAPSKKAGKASTSTKNTSGKKNMDPALNQLFLDEIKDIYWAEKHLVKTLPKLKKGATSKQLANAFDDHLEQTKTHVERLEKVFSLLGVKAQAKKCDAMEGLAKEATGVLEDTDAGTATRDVALIIAAQKAEHYEIATYGGLAVLAKTLGFMEVKKLLGETLSEEKKTDELLTTIAENDINYEAAEED